MAKAFVYNVNAEKRSQIELPIQFSEPIRLDLIRRVVIALQSHRRQPYGSDPKAGTKQGYHTPKRRHKYKTTYDKGISRVRRKHLWHRGSQFGWVAAFIGNAVGGKKVFPPHADRKWHEKINKKERKKATRSALAAVSQNMFVVEDKLETLSKTKDVEKMFSMFKVEIGKKKIRAGRGKSRGRKYRTSKGPLLVVSQPSAVERSARNFLGVDIVQVKNLNVELLIPGSNLIRKTLWSKSAVEKLSKEKLFQ